MQMTSSSLTRSAASEARWTLNFRFATIRIHERVRRQG
jgi:hypothetical protein